MNLTDFRRAGHAPTLLSAFVYFDVSFMVWVLIGALGNSLAADFQLSPEQKGLIVAVPLLGGAVLRIVLGVLTDRIGARRTALIGLTLTMPPLSLGWLWVSRYEQLFVVGSLLGVAGASFAAALPMASRWYPLQYQGLALGIAGAGNSGTALATFFGPRLAAAWGWHRVFGLALIPVVLAWLMVWFLAKDASSPPAPRRLHHYFIPLKTFDAWWFCLFYSVTFGGFVGLASFLNIFFHDQYGVSDIDAGNYATLCVIAGSLIRPVGGYLADRIGGIRMLLALYLGASIFMGMLSFLPPLGWGTLLLFLGMGLLGMANGAVFQLVPQRFPREIGVMTGLIGAAGGVGGFILPNVLGIFREVTGSFSGGFILFAMAGFACAGLLAAIRSSWERGFVGRGGLAAEAP